MCFRKYMTVNFALLNNRHLENPIAFSKVRSRGAIFFARRSLT